MKNEIFVDFISRLSIGCKDKGVKAKIKRSGGRSAVCQAEGVMEIMRLNPPIYSIDNPDGCKFDTCYKVSAWYAQHPMNVGNKSFAKSLSELKIKMNSQTLDKKVLTMVRFGRIRMIREVSRLISLLKHHNIAIDYAGLMEDIKYWSKRYKNGSVQCRWIQEYSKVEMLNTEKEE